MSTQFDKYHHQVARLIWQDNDGFTFDFESLDKRLQIPFRNSMTADRAAEILLNEHKNVLHYIEAANAGDTSARDQLKGLFKRTKIYYFKK